MVKSFQLPLTCNQIVLEKSGLNKSESKELEEDAYLNLKITNKNVEDLPYLKNKLNSIVSHINKLYETDRLPFLEGDPSDIDQDKLNYLHEMFEEYGEESLDPEKFLSEEAS